MMKCRDRIEVMGKLRGATAMHLAAGMGDDSMIADTLLEKLPQAKAAWNSARNAQGQSPADVAYMYAILSSSH